MSEEGHRHGHLQKSWHGDIWPIHGAINAFLRREGTAQGIGGVHLHVHVVSEGIDDLVGEIVVLFLNEKTGKSKRERNQGT